MRCVTSVYIPPLPKFKKNTAIIRTQYITLSTCYNLFMESKSFYLDTPPKLSRREHARILGVRAVIAGLQDSVSLRPMGPLSGAAVEDFDGLDQLGDED